MFLINTGITSILRLLLLSMLAFLVACGGTAEKPVEEEPEVVEPAPEPEPMPEPEPEPAPEPEEEVVVLANPPSFKVFFDFDKSDISSEYQFGLNAHANFMLEQDLEIFLVLEGHADERGTREYNLALGERRANAVKDYLELMGVDPDRISVISFGEDVPLYEEHNEYSWSLNRRVEFVYEE